MCAQRKEIESEMKDFSYLTEPRFRLEPLVLEMVNQIPRGLVSTPGAIADSLGDRAAARFVGRIVTSPPDSDLPVYRVVYSDSRVRDAPGSSENAEMLASEGIVVSAGKVRGFKTIFFGVLGFHNLYLNSP